jgi:hypothetical protein
MAGNTSAPGATVVSRTVTQPTAFDEAHPRCGLAASQNPPLPVLEATA